MNTADIEAFAAFLGIPFVDALWLLSASVREDWQ